MNRLPIIPFERAYWAAQGRLLAGCYPGDVNPEKARRKLKGLIDCGVDRVVNLMEAAEVDHNGKPFVDYRTPLEILARESSRAIQVERHPLRDYDVPTVAQMKRILEAVDGANTKEAKQRLSRR
jgi:hypothetical protein